MSVQRGRHGIEMHFNKADYFLKFAPFLFQNKNIEPYTNSCVYNVFYLHRYYFYNVITYIVIISITLSENANGTRVLLQ